jgi:hypothetical protein
VCWQAEGVHVLFAQTGCMLWRGCKAGCGRDMMRSWLQHGYMGTSSGVGLLNTLLLLCADTMVLLAGGSSSFH